ncbi:MAG TPA: response regulator [Candidatus Limnocylindrales bacterium]|nr:response regulator [Candidatus Limnocylindrales bacterium]
MTNARILIVEDNAIIARYLGSMLSRANYEVVGIVPSGEEAIEKAIETHPDLVLMDITLEGKMDGIEAAEHIYARFNIPIIYITSLEDSSTIRRIKASQAFGYISKPTKDTELLTAIEMALHRLKTGTNC